MNKTVKIILIVGGVLLVICCVVGGIIAYIVPTAVTQVAERSFTESPEEAAAIGRTMLNYELPPGYQEMAAMDLGFKMVLIGQEGTENSDMVIMLMEFPGSIMDEEEMRQQIQQSAAEQTGGGIVNREEIQTETITINGEEATLTTLIGTDENGTKIRQLTAPFVSKDGGVGMLMLMGAEADWNSDAAGTFLSSIE